MTGATLGVFTSTAIDHLRCQEVYFGDIRAEQMNVRFRNRFTDICERKDRL